jgi:hypothetical protein
MEVFRAEFKTPCLSTVCEDRRRTKVTGVTSGIEVSVEASLSQGEMHVHVPEGMKLQLIAGSETTFKVVSK